VAILWRFSWFARLGLREARWLSGHSVALAITRFRVSLEFDPG